MQKLLGVLAMKKLAPLLLALPLNAGTITHVVNLPDTTVVDDGTSVFQSFLVLSFTVPQYSGNLADLQSIEVAYSGHLHSGFTWTLEAAGEDLSFTLARSTHFKLGGPVRYGEVFFGADPITLQDWNTGAFLNYPDLIDGDFAQTITSFPVTEWSEFIGSGDVFASFRVRNFIDKAQTGEFMGYIGFPEVSTAVSNVQVVVTYATTPEPGTWIAGTALIGAWFRRRSSFHR